MIHTRYSRLVSGAETVSVTNVFTGDSEFAFDGDIAFGVEKHLAVTIDPAEVESLMIYGGGKALTVCTNDAKAGSPTDTIHVPAGHVYLWARADGTPNPFTMPVVGIYITNEDSALTAAVAIRVLQTVVVP